MALTFSANIWFNLQYFSSFPPKLYVFMVFKGLFGDIWWYLVIFTVFSPPV